MIKNRLLYTQDTVSAVMLAYRHLAKSALSPQAKEFAINAYGEMYQRELAHIASFLGSKKSAEINLSERGIWSPKHARMWVYKKLSHARTESLKAKYSPLRNN